MEWVVFGRQRGRNGHVLRLRCKQNRVVPNTDFAGYPAARYPANNFAGHRIESIDFFSGKKIREIFSLHQNLPTLLVAIFTLIL